MLRRQRELPFCRANLGLELVSLNVDRIHDPSGNNLPVNQTNQTKIYGGLLKIFVFNYKIGCTITHLTVKNEGTLDYVD